MNQTGKKKKVFDGRYEVLSIVGRGSASVVYHARHVTTQSSEVALKVLLDQKKGKESNSDRLRKEALAMVSSRHKYVVRLDDFHSVKDLCYLSMEYAKEGDLRKYSKKIGGKIPLPQAEQFFTQSAEALNFVHRVGITHRDIKPDNILVMNDREIRLADFGVAVLPGEHASIEDLQNGVGTMSYMAPEVLEGKVCDKLSDMYALALTFYEMITGIHPFENAPLLKQLEVREDKNLKHIAKLAPSISKPLANVIMQALSYDSASRFSSMAELLKALNNRGSDQKPAQPATKKPAEQAAVKAPEAKRQVPNFRKEAPAAASTAQAPKVEARKQEAVVQTPAPKVEIKPEVLKPEPVIIEDDFEIIPEKSSEGFIDKDDTPELDLTQNISAANESESYEDDILEDDAESENYESENKVFTYESKPSGVKDYKARDYKSSSLSSSAARNVKKEPAPLWFRLAIAAMMIFAGNYILNKFFNLNVLGFLTSSRPSQEAEITPGGEFILPKVTDSIENFPELPGGIYSGSMSSLSGESNTALTIISLPEITSLVVIPGVQGWTPSASTYMDTKSEEAKVLTKIRVASNGTVLDFSGEASGDNISGTYLNAITGEKGTWQVKPQR